MHVTPLDGREIELPAAAGIAGDWVNALGGQHRVGLAALLLRESYGLSFEQLALLLHRNRGHICRAVQQAAKAIETLQRRPIQLPAIWSREDRTLLQQRHPEADPDDLLAIELHLLGAHWSDQQRVLRMNRGQRLKARRRAERLPLREINLLFPGRLLIRPGSAPPAPAETARP